MIMVIKNKTVITEAAVKGAMYAANFDNNRYKTFKIIYNVFGLAFGMMLVRTLVFWVLGKGGSVGELVLYGLSAAVLLYIGMIGMDKSRRRQFHQTYAGMINRSFFYEIDSEHIYVVDEDKETDQISWNDIIKWTQDTGYFYLFLGNTKCLILDKKGFEGEGALDLKELAAAVMGLREKNRMQE